jgi:hypothetical protein
MARLLVQSLGPTISLRRQAAKTGGHACARQLVCGLTRPARVVFLCRMTCADMARAGVGIRGTVAAARVGVKAITGLPMLEFRRDLAAGVACQLNGRQVRAA